MNVWVIGALKSGIKNSKMVKSRVMMHHNVVGQELRWLKSTQYCCFHHLRRSTFVHKNFCEPLEHVENVSEPNTDTGTENEMCVPCGFLIYSYKNKWDFVSDWLRRTWRNFKIWITGIARKWSLFTNRGFSTMILNSNVKVRCGGGVKTSESSAVKIGWEGPIDGIFWL